MTFRKPGRPPRPLVDCQKLMGAALELLEAGGLKAVTMRALGRHLGVNPMATYHYFESKEAVLAAAAACHFRRFRPRLGQRDLERRLLAFGLSYGRFLQRSVGLLHYLVTTPAAAVSPVEHFDRLFTRALGDHQLSAPARETARNALADLVHGFALAGPGVPLRLLENELRLLVGGIVCR
jgi:TetR/AcrR family tetracycline transcriptional repressor